MIHDIVDDDGEDIGDAPEDIPETTSLADAADALTISPRVEGIPNTTLESGAAGTTRESGAVAEDAVPRGEDDVPSGGDVAGRVGDAADNVSSTSSS